MLPRVATAVLPWMTTHHHALRAFTHVVAFELLRRFPAGHAAWDTAANTSDDRYIWCLQVSPLSRVSYFVGRRGSVRSVGVHEQRRVRGAGTRLSAFLRRPQAEGDSRVVLWPSALRELSSAQGR